MSRLESLSMVSEGVVVAEKGPIRLTMLPVNQLLLTLYHTTAMITYQLRQEYRTNRREVKFGKYREGLSF